MTRRRIAIIGSRGRLGAALVRLWSADHDVTGFARPEIDLTKGKSIDQVLKKSAYDFVVNCAAFTNVDACESDPAEAETVNVKAPARMAALCAATDTRFLHVSTDYVYDGRRTSPYTEDIPVSRSASTATRKLRENAPSNKPTRRRSSPASPGSSAPTAPVSST